ncbi:hypothetical protein DFJ77DRAFT_187622 [Powellomyces hirtus]|nr:hypothetical protein DFJ77DRAFT_257784 [Powellomyces hirtus]KAI8907035.1 hypothetical protein DFJ77DRAFT_187622 [Powellomyces hirtus]
MPIIVTLLIAVSVVVVAIIHSWRAVWRSDSVILCFVPFPSYTLPLRYKPLPLAGGRAGRSRASRAPTAASERLTSLSSRSIFGRQNPRPPASAIMSFVLFLFLGGFVFAPPSSTQIVKRNDNQIDCRCQPYRYPLIYQ